MPIIYGHIYFFIKIRNYLIIERDHPQIHIAAFNIFLQLPMSGYISDTCVEVESLESCDNYIQITLFSYILFIKPMTMLNTFTLDKGS